MNLCARCRRPLAGKRADARYCSDACRTATRRQRKKPGTAIARRKPNNNPRRNSYSDAEIEQGLAALAIFSGNAARASRELERIGVRIPSRTLGDWKRAHAERYREIQQEVQPEINAEIAESSERLVRRLTEVEWELIDRIESELPQMTGTQAGTALQRVTWSKGVNADKSRVYRELPTEIKRSEMSFEEALRALQKFSNVVQINPALLEGEAIEEET
jgi:hypothetical protein